MGSRLFAKLIRRFSEKYPLVHFHLYNEMADNIKDRMDKGLIDVGLLLEPVDTAKYDFVRLSQKETWGVLMRDDHPLAEREYITPDEIAEYPLILPLRDWGALSAWTEPWRSTAARICVLSRSVRNIRRGAC